MTRAHDEMEAALELAVLGLDEPPYPPVAYARRGDGLAVGMLSSVTRMGEGGAIAELAVFLAALRPEAAAIVVPVVLREVDGPMLDRRLSVVGIDATGGGQRLDAWAVPADDRADPTRRTITPAETHPTAALLADAVQRTRVDLPWLVVAAVLGDRGHRVTFRDVDPAVLEEQRDAAADVPMKLARHRVRRLSRELERRHRPMAPLAERRTAPAAPCDAPPGWEPACAI